MGLIAVLIFILYTVIRREFLAKTLKFHKTELQESFSLVYHNS